jgi:hypothetical protein
MEKYICTQDYIGHLGEKFFLEGHIYKFRPSSKGWFKTNESNLKQTHEIDEYDLKQYFILESEALEPKKKIIIEESNGKISFNTEGFSDFEIMGLLSFYESWFKNKTLKENKRDLRKK